MNFRKTLFKLLRNKQHITMKRNIEKIKENIFTPIEINEKRLDEFLSYITEKSTFYEKFKNKDIQSYPIMDKKTFQNNIEKISTVSTQDLENLPYRKTSGSYGTPQKFHVNSEKILSQQAQILFFGQWSGFDIGTKHLYLRSLEPDIKRQIIKNQYIIKPEKITNEWLETSIRKIMKLKPKVIIGYPTTLEYISKEINTNYPPLSFVHGIITSGENLTSNAEIEISKAFQIKPLSRYSTEELGVLANSLPTEKGMILNQVDFLIEILDRDNNPVKEGEVGRVIVTDFYSHVMPLVRYDTGDLAKVMKIEDNLVINISQIEGRLVETLFTTDGEILTPYAINIKMRDYSTIQQFQFIQETSTDYTLNIVPTKKVEKNDYSELINKLEKVLGASSKITLNIVDEIEALSSGKRPYIINKLLR